MEARKLDVVVKLTEVCNLDCSYCYFFHSDVKSHLNHSATIRPHVPAALADFILRSHAEWPISRTTIVFHGGEPMLLRPALFDRICGSLRDALTGRVEFNFTMTTNATLVSDKWIDILARHRVGVAVSIDGPAEYHDVERRDHKGRGSHAAVVVGIKRLQEACAAGLLGPIAALAVVDPRFNGAAVYRHIVHDLGIKGYDILFPDVSREHSTKIDSDGITRYVNDAFQAWVDDDDPSVKIRFFLRYLHRFLNRSPYAPGTNVRRDDVDVLAFTSDGKVVFNDEYRQVAPQLFDREYEPADWTVRGVVNDVAQSKYASGLLRPIPEPCAPCEWVGVCRGGETESRYSSERGFDNPSVFCNVLQGHLIKVEDYLLKSGIQQKLLREACENVSV